MGSFALQNILHAYASKHPKIRRNVTVYTTSATSQQVQLVCTNCLKMNNQSNCQYSKQDVMRDPCNKLFNTKPVTEAVGLP